MRYQLDLTLRQAEGALSRVLGAAERRGFRPLAVDGEAQADGDRWYLRLTVEGERRSENEEKGEGFYRTERSYGSFRREIPLPEGVNTENAKAEFKNGVLEISMQAPPQIASGKKRLEISEGK